MVVICFAKDSCGVAVLVTDYFMRTHEHNGYEEEDVEERFNIVSGMVRHVFDSKLDGHVMHCSLYESLTVRSS